MYENIVEKVRIADRQYRDALKSEFYQAGSRAGVSLDPERTVYAARHDARIALAPTSDSDVADLLMFYDQPDTACAKTLPPGFYLVKTVSSDEGTGNIKVKISDLDRKHILSLTAKREGPKPGSPDKLSANGVSLQDSYTEVKFCRLIIQDDGTVVEECTVYIIDPSAPT
jgi:hypothetical protein